MSKSVEMNYSADAAVDCSLCWKPTGSALFVNGTLRPSNLMGIQLWICDDCLMLVIKAVPLFEWGAREAKEAWAILGEEAR